MAKIPTDVERSVSLTPPKDPVTILKTMFIVKQPDYPPSLTG